MFDIVLYEPEIPPNTGNVMRLCANTGSRLHLIEPLGFSLDEKRLRRAGLDYRDMADVKVWPNLAACKAELATKRWFALSSKVQTPYSNTRFAPGDALLFGPETRGLPRDVLDDFNDERLLTIPMKEGSRSLNLSNSVSVVVYEAWRQCDFADARDAKLRLD
ncbi:MAG: tRNA (cytidine(34)-2'-O)-methyltransferase [Pseudomonadota bacterium]